MQTANYFFMFIKLVALMVTASALPIGIVESDPTTQLSIMFVGMLIFWCAHILEMRLVK